MLADRPGWAFSQIARSLGARLSDRYDMRLVHREVEPVELRDEDVDLLYVFFWGDDSYQHLGIDPAKIVKEVASHRWALEERYGRLSLEEFARTRLADCRLVTTPSRRLYDELRRVCDSVAHCPNGVETGVFRPGRPRRGRLRVGWVGNPGDACKGLRDVLVPACEGRFALERTDGRRDRDEVARLYRRCDVIAIASTAESQPLPLLEGMACGCFPVATDVGIVPELVRSPRNGLVVERSVEAFREAFAWCDANLDDVRRAGAANAELIRAERSWDGRLAERFAEVFDAVLGRRRAFASVPELPRSEARASIERGAIPWRVAFVAAEYATRDTRGGGLGAYVQRMARALAAQGHRVEVFAPGEGVATGPGDGRASVGEGDRVRVHWIPRGHAFAPVRAALRACRLLSRPGLGSTLLAVVEAFLLARALARREREVRFDCVQSSDHRAAGLFVPGLSRRGRPHLVRCSSDEAALCEVNGGDPAPRRWLDRLQRLCLRRADSAYAPSRFLARHYAERYGIELEVLYPPALADPAPPPVPIEDLPKRFFLHFGQLTPAKGTPDVAAALPRVWEHEPDFEMVWAGADRCGLLAQWRRAWGDRHRQVHWLGELPRSELHAVLARAEAAVLPSRFDNLPNTSIESVAHGIPVIATRGASLDEIVVPGGNGELVPVADPDALADAMIRLWRSSGRFRRSSDAGLPAPMEPAAAVQGLLALASRGAPGERVADAAERGGSRSR